MAASRSRRSTPVAALAVLLLAVLASEAHGAGRALLRETRGAIAKTASAATVAGQYPGFRPGPRPYGAGGAFTKPASFAEYDDGPGGNYLGDEAIYGNGGTLRGLGGARASAEATAATSPGRRPAVALGGGGWRRFDRSYLTPLVPTTLPNAAAAAAANAGAVRPDALRFSQTLAEADARAAAQGMVGGRADVVAEGIIDAAAQGRRGRIADALAYSAAMNRGATASVLSRSANYALMRGQVDPFADATADAFLACRRRGTIRDFSLAMADAVSQGGDYGRYAYGQAIAKAVASGGDGQAAVAEATAEVYCSSDLSAASAWSSAFAVALNQDQNGCLVLTKARALAAASCGGGVFNSFADSESTSRVLGFCGLLPAGAAPDYSYVNNDSGAWGGKK